MNAATIRNVLAALALLGGIVRLATVESPEPRAEVVASSSGGVCELGSSCR